MPLSNQNEIRELEQLQKQGNQSEIDKRLEAKAEQFIAKSLDVLIKSEGVPVGQRMRLSDQDQKTLESLKKEFNELVSKFSDKEPDRLLLVAAKRLMDNNPNFAALKEQADALYMYVVKPDDIISYTELKNSEQLKKAEPKLTNYIQSFSIAPSQPARKAEARAEKPKKVAKPIRELSRGQKEELQKSANEWMTTFIETINKNESSLTEDDNNFLLNFPQNFKNEFDPVASYNNSMPLLIGAIDNYLKTNEVSTGKKNSLTKFMYSNNSDENVQNLEDLKDAIRIDQVTRAAKKNKDLALRQTNSNEELALTQVNEKIKKLTEICQNYKKHLGEEINKSDNKDEVAKSIDQVINELNEILARPINNAELPLSDQLLEQHKKIVRYEQILEKKYPILIQHRKDADKPATIRFFKDVGTAGIAIPYGIVRFLAIKAATVKDNLIGGDTKRKIEHALPPVSNLVKTKGEQELVKMKDVIHDRTPAAPEGPRNNNIK